MKLGYQSMSAEAEWSRDSRALRGIRDGAREICGMDLHRMIQQA
jgi:hypothetical protein